MFCIFKSDKWDPHIETGELWLMGDRKNTNLDSSMTFLIQFPSPHMQPQTSIKQIYYESQ